MVTRQGCAWDLLLAKETIVSHFGDFIVVVHVKSCILWVLSYLEIGKVMGKKKRKTR